MKDNFQLGNAKKQNIYNAVKDLIEFNGMNFEDLGINLKTIKDYHSIKNIFQAFAEELKSETFLLRQFDTRSKSDTATTLESKVKQDALVEALIKQLNLNRSSLGELKNQLKSEKNNLLLELIPGLENLKEVGGDILGSFNDNVRHFAQQNNIPVRVLNNEIFLPLFNLINVKSILKEQGQSLPNEIKLSAIRLVNGVNTQLSRLHDKASIEAEESLQIISNFLLDD
ncbi:MAG: hypothetical protein HRT47_03555 [Candidatus Caenarcaniphilales bacterium]|nr:hypothetical protein [Candidatus Caenarcaniphilales bacterium]